MISVCMAVFNGEVYLHQQIDSILDQLSEVDELIIVDDCSTDHSSQIISNLNDQRIKYYKNNTNIGVLGTFERAINLSHGDNIFLSDQDDVWYPHKIERIMFVFNSMKHITMVTTDATVIDDEGLTICDSFFSKRGKFRPDIINTLLKNKYLGCTIAFRRSIISKLLPIPQNVPMHDIWFGAMNSLYGKTYFINEPLIFYRRHKKNVTKDGSENFTRQLLWRIRLITSILLRVFHLRHNCLF